MASVKIYTWTVCPYCVRAKNLLNSKGIVFEEINLDGRDQELEELRKRTGMRTIPQIFINDQLIGGYTELAQLEGEGQLDELLKNQATPNQILNSVRVIIR